ncbi:Cytokinin dehydrogenase 3, partial [Linum perenne]
HRFTIEFIKSSIKMMRSDIKLLTTILLVTHLSTFAASQTPTCPLPNLLGTQLRTDPSSLVSVSVDYGNIVEVQPSAVVYPESADDISLVIKSSYNCLVPYGIAARGNGHCTRGQDMVSNGVVLAMKSLHVGGPIRVSKNPLFVDVAGGSLWMDVLNATLKEGVTPVTWTDFLYLTVGGTLSNAGIGGNTFRFGPQISNVLEMDVVTGKGDIITCSANNNPELFNGVLGGFGQFGVITRARLALASAPQRVKWARFIYSNFADFTKDQESINANNGRDHPSAVDYLEGQILLDNGTPNTWETIFFPTEAQPTITSLVQRNGIVYVLELAIYYDKTNEQVKEQQLKQLTNWLKNDRGLAFVKDVSYQEFLSRVQLPYTNTQAHPWLNLFVPKSGISQFDSGVFRGILLQRNISVGPVLFYPVNRNKWDNNMSAVIPNEDVFYAFSLLSETNTDDLQKHFDQNAAVLEYCEKTGIKISQYLPSYSTQQAWIEHFGPKWATFLERKAQFDPKFILSPGQKIFN